MPSKRVSEKQAASNVTPAGGGEEEEDRWTQMLRDQGIDEDDVAVESAPRLWDDETNRKKERQEQRKREREDERETKRAEKAAQKAAAPPKPKKGTQQNPAQPTIAAAARKAAAIAKPQELDARVKAMLQEDDDDEDERLKATIAATAAARRYDDSDDDEDLDLEALRALTGTQVGAGAVPGSQTIDLATQQFDDAENVPAAPSATVGFGADAVEAVAPTSTVGVAKGSKKPTTAATAVAGGAPKANYAIKAVDLRDNAEAEVKVEQQEEAPVAAQPVPQVQGQGQMMYWLDAKERDSYQVIDPGTVMLFGKQHNPATNNYESCCVRVHGMYRSCLILGAADADDKAVVRAISMLCSGQGITERRVKIVKRWYAFEEEGVPQGCHKWFKLRYPADCPPLDASPSKLANHPEILKVMGASRSLIELLLLKRRIKGPCYLKLGDTKPVPEASMLTHCKMEYILSSPKQLFADPQVVFGSDKAPDAPMLTAMSLHLDVQLDSSGKHNEIHAAAMVFHRNVSADGRTMTGSSVPYTKRMIGIRPFDSNSSIPLELGTHCAKKHLSDGDRSTVRIFQNEEKMLDWVLQNIKEQDPDLLVGHNFAAYTLDILLHRLKKDSLWSIVGRVKAKVMPQLQVGVGGTREATYEEKQLCCGRLIVDSYTQAKEHYKTTSYKVAELCKGLGIEGIFGKIEETQQLDSRVMLNGKMTIEDLYRSLSHCLNVAVMSLGIVFRLDVVPLTKRLTCVAGNLWARTLNGARAERIEYLLLHSFHEKKFVTPDRRTTFNAKTSRKTAREREDHVLDADEEPGTTEGPAKEGQDGDAATGPKKTKYLGGKVLEPIRGLYTDYVLLLDFNSLYPSIIQEFNICFTTVDRVGKHSVADGVTLPTTEDLTCSECEGKTSAGTACPHKCILPRVIAGLVTQRRAVKKLMKTEQNPATLAQYDIRQKALKLTANSMYGCLGFEFSRFFAQPLAELVTMQGREALTNAADLVPSASDQHQLRVVYGDTDSVMVQTGIKQSLPEARAVAERIKAQVNKKYRNLEIDIDGIFRALLLVRKKKYAAVTVEDWAGEGVKLKQETKGLDMVRRDWCPLSKETSNAILEKLLWSHKPHGSGDTDGEGDGGDDDILRFILQKMTDIAERCRAGTIPLEQYVITKSITKDPSLYAKNSAPHATVALRMIEKKINVMVGDLIPFVICQTEEAKGTANASLSSRALHVDECRRAQVPIDVEWYLETQILPPVQRLCEHLQGFSLPHLAESMGLTKLAAAQRDNADSNIAGGVGASTATANYRPCFKTDELEQLETVFHSDEPVKALELKCRSCFQVVPIQPHTACREIVNGTFKQHADDIKKYNTPSEVEFRHHVTANSVLTSEAKQEVTAPRVWLYRCTNCGKHFPLGLVSNALTLAVRRAQRRFYEDGGTAIARKRLTAQMRYFRALFDVPQHPGCEPSIINTHRRVLRLYNDVNEPFALGDIRDRPSNIAAAVAHLNGAGITGEEDHVPTSDLDLDQEGQPATRDPVARMPDDALVNLPLEVAVMAYNKLDGLFIHVDNVI